MGQFWKGQTERFSKEKWGHSTCQIDRKWKKIGASFSDENKSFGKAVWSQRRKVFVGPTFPSIPPFFFSSFLPSSSFSKILINEKTLFFSPLLSIKGFDPVFGVGLDAFHQILGPPKELILVLWRSTLKGDSEMYDFLSINSGRSWCSSIVLSSEKRHCCQRLMKESRALSFNLTILEYPDPFVTYLTSLVCSLNVPDVTFILQLIA